MQRFEITYGERTPYPSDAWKVQLVATFLKTGNHAVKMKLGICKQKHSLMRMCMVFMNEGM